MTLVERGGTIGTYSSGVKMTLKVRITPMETTKNKNNAVTMADYAAILTSISISILCAITLMYNVHHGQKFETK